MPPLALQRPSSVTTPRATASPPPAPPSVPTPPPRASAPPMPPPRASAPFLRYNASRYGFPAASAPLAFQRPAASISAANIALAFQRPAAALRASAPHSPRSGSVSCRLRPRPAQRAFGSEARKKVIIIRQFVNSLTRQFENPLPPPDPLLPDVHKPIHAALLPIHPHML